MGSCWRHFGFGMRHWESAPPRSRQWALGAFNRQLALEVSFERLPGHKRIEHKELEWVDLLYWPRMQSLWNDGQAKGTALFQLPMASVADGRLEKEKEPLSKQLRLLNLWLSYQLVQALTGHAKCNDYLFRLGLVDSPNCLCQTRVETVEHFLLFCAASKSCVQYPPLVFVSKICHWHACFQS